MIEKDAIAGIHAVGFTVVDRNPVGIEFGHRVRAAGIKRQGFLLRNFLHQTIQIGG